jgi:hypothetical protein
MARVGLPPGNQYPSRAELRATLQPYVQNVREIGANRGYQKYDDLSRAYSGESDLYYSPKNEDSVEPVVIDFGDQDAPAVLTDVPTSSTNYSRPRTVAAGYDTEERTMTVVFRDGTFYNYYDVTPGEWQAFSSSLSKGKPWLNRANSKQAMDGIFIGKRRGRAEVTSVPAEIREQLYRVARSQQIARPPRKKRRST